MGLIKSIKICFVEIWRFLKECHSANAVMKCSLIAWIRQLLSSFYGYFSYQNLPVEKDYKKFEKDLEVLQNEGLINISMISQYFRSHFRKDCLFLVCFGRKYSKYHINDLAGALRKSTRRGYTEIEIKGPSCSFKFIIKKEEDVKNKCTNYHSYCESNSMYLSRSSNNIYNRSSNNIHNRSSNNIHNRSHFVRMTKPTQYKYLEITNIIRKSIRLKDEIDKKHNDTLHTSPCSSKSFYVSRRFKTIDKISLHDKSTSKASIIKFYTLYGDYIFKKNVSWYFSPPFEYKILVGTDVVGSTRLWNASYEGMSVAITKHDYLVLDLLDKCGGVFSRNEGDAFYLFFRTIEGATKFALLLKKHGEKIKVFDEHLKIKIAIHHGEVQMSDSLNQNCIGEPVSQISKMLSHYSDSKICISKRILNKHTEKNLSKFCIHQ